MPASRQTESMLIYALSGYLGKRARAPHNHLQSKGHHTDWRGSIVAPQRTFSVRFAVQEHWPPFFKKILLGPEYGREVRIPPPMCWVLTACLTRPP